MQQRKIPIRQCMGCREHKPKRELLRVTRSPEGEISLDFQGKKPGRGVYLCIEPKCFARVRKSRALDRALKASVPELVYEQLQKHVEEGSG